MICRNVDAIAITLLLLGFALFSTAKDRGLVQVVEGRRIMVSKMVVRGLMNCPNSQPSRVKYF